MAKDKEQIKNTTQKTKESHKNWSWIHVLVYDDFIC